MEFLLIAGREGFDGWVGPTMEFLLIAGREGFEPPTTGFGDQRSDQTELPP
jgi:hypothetical protein